MEIAGRKISTGLIIGVVLGIIVLWGVIWYNGALTASEDVEGQWGNVQSSYQRRMDLIPGLVKAVKGYAKHEETVFREVAEAQAKIGAIQVDASKLTEADIQKYQESQEAMKGATLGRLMALAIQYPDLQASASYQQFMTDYTGTENRINRERDLFNDAAKEFNKKIQRIPGNLFNIFAGFEKKPYFQSQPGADKGVNVDL